MPYLAQSEVGIFYVEYRAYNPASDKLERYRIYKGFRKCQSSDDVEKLAEKIISTYANKLRSGWRPWDGSVYLYRDELEYHQISALRGSDRKDSSHLRKYLSEFLEIKKLGVAKKSFQSYLSKTRLFCNWLEENDHGHKLIGEITNDIVVDFFRYLISERELDKRTVAKYKQNLHSMFSFFKQKKLIDELPLEHLPRAVRKVDEAARPLSDIHMKKYMSYIADHDPQLFLASLFQLLLLVRPNRELRLMRIQDIDLVKGIAYVRDETAKTKARVVTVPQALMEITHKYQLFRYPGHYYIFGRGGKPGPDPVGVNYFNRKFCEAKKELGLPDVYKFYSFKHTGAGKLMESGASLAELMSHLGHTRFESTIHYVRRHFGERSEKIANFRPEFLDGL